MYWNFRNRRIFNQRKVRNKLIDKKIIKDDDSEITYEIIEKGDETKLYKELKKNGSINAKMLSYEIEILLNKIEFKSKIINTNMNCGYNQSNIMNENKNEKRILQDIKTKRFEIQNKDYKLNKWN